MSINLLESELILNKDGSIYHLALLPGEIASDIITVGDPDRVDLIIQHFDRIELEKQNREFKTVTGYIGQKRLSVIATGIGTDNIDIVFNELDALVNIDFDKRQVLSEKTSLNFYRIGTSGSIHPEIDVDSFVASRYGIGLDALGHYYEGHGKVLDINIEAIQSIVNKPMYATQSSEELLSKFQNGYHHGVTMTAPGFYAPQGRNLRLASSTTINLDNLYKNTINETPITNLEMETAGIYLLANYFGHKAISLNAIMANRSSGKFSLTPQKTINKLIDQSLHKIVS